MRYKIPIPRSRGALAQTLLAPESVLPFAIPDIVSPGTIVRDIILHALIVRIAYDDDHTEEFLTRLAEDGTLEIDIPQDRLDLLTSDVTLGLKLQQFIAWLTSRDALTPSTITMTASGTITDSRAILTVLLDASVGDLVVILPTPNKNQIINLKKIDSSGHKITVLPPSGTVDGEDSFTIVIQYESFQLASDGTNFFVV